MKFSEKPSDNRDVLNYEIRKPNGNKIRKVMALSLSLMLVMSSAVCAYAVNRTPAGLSLSATLAISPASQPKGLVQVYVKPDVTIIVKGGIRTFRDAKGTVVYPVIYNGSTYLPVRAISGLMEEDIEWDEYSKTIFMGKTFSNPNKIKRPVSTEGTIAGGENSASIATEPMGGVFEKPAPSMIAGYLRPNFLIMYDFELQNFKDEQDKVVYPIVVNGSTYLPIRAISDIMKQAISWDGLNKIVTIGSADQPVIEKSAATEAITSQFEKQVSIYDSATVKIKNLQKAAGVDDMMIIATEVSKDYMEAAANTLYVNSMDTKEYSEDELAAYLSLKEFTVISEHYILVLENIAYMAAAEQDYSMLAETFMNFALESQKKLDETRALVEAL